MVECEFDEVLEELSDFQVLIDTWWNVNSNYILAEFEDVIVLIDTWWNVNLSSVCLSLKAVVVLIDTWWNVNCLRLPALLIYFRFNRYMVECEFVHNAYNIPGTKCFNRYMVECELI